MTRTYRILWPLLCLTQASLGLAAEQITRGRCPLEFIQLKEQIEYRQVGSIRIFSLIGRDQNLKKEAETAGRDTRVQNEMDNLIEKEIKRDKQNAAQSPGFGRASLGNGYFELKGCAGGRVYIKRVPRPDDDSGGGEDVYVVGKATKKGSGNDYIVLNILRSKYADFPKPPNSMGDRRQR